MHTEDFWVRASKIHFILHFTPCCTVSYMFFKRFISYNFQFSFQFNQFSVHKVRSWYFKNDHFELHSPIISGFVLRVIPLSIHSHAFNLPVCFWCLAPKNMLLYMPHSYNTHLPCFTYISATSNYTKN